jgi:hypothetical protein
MKLQLLGWPFPDGTLAEEPEQFMAALREMRDVLLKESDWTQIPDCALPQEIKDQWRLWRQYMRDLPSLVDTPLEYTIEFDEPPANGRPSSWDNWDVSRGAVPYGVREI